MSYVKEVYEGLAANHPHEGEFLQAAEEVLTSIEPAVEKNPVYRQQAILERLTEPDRAILFRGWMIRASCMSTVAIACSSTMPLAPIRAACACIPA